MPTTWTKARSRVANIARNHPEDTDALEDARRELKVVRAEDYIRRVVSEAPELTDEQVDRLTSLFRRPPGDSA